MAQKSQSHEMGMHTEQLGGRTQQRFFEPAEAENFVYPDAFDVDVKQRKELDAGKLSRKDINLKISEMTAQGSGTINSEKRTDGREVVGTSRSRWRQEQ